MNPQIVFTFGQEGLYTLLMVAAPMLALAFWRNAAACCPSILAPDAFCPTVQVFVLIANNDVPLYPEVSTPPESPI